MITIIDLLRTKNCRPKQSFVWNYFNTVNNINYCQVSVPISTKSPYGICNHKVENGSTTTNMINHLRKIHKIINPVEQELYKAQGQRDMRDFIVQAKPLTKDQMSFLRKKVLKFIIEDLQPFYILESNSFKELLLSLHPFFEIPTEEALDKLLDNMFEIGQTYLKNTFENVSKISLTTDFWTSRGQHGYIGVTAHWISDDYNPKEAFLTLQHVHYPHTSEVIKDKLKDIIINWNISNKVTFIATDNAASMVKSIKLLKDEFGIERISCAAHTLQLVIGKALTCNTNIQIFILRVKRLVYFFSSPKQLEHLISAQEQLNYPKIYKTIKDVQTRWNSSFYSWKRLLLLKGALTYLPNKLKADNIKENKKDGDRLERIMLSDEEWKFMETLEEILEEFEEIPDGEIADTIEINEKGSKKSLNILRSVETKGLLCLKPIDFEKYG
ncbi:unnamed protein product [Rhizophagus irregularis]|nr:unnamed protein product [Rhizophagus irregularis]